jgi:hypothetical protein
MWSHACGLVYFFSVMTPLTVTMRLMSNSTVNE